VGTKGKIILWDLDQTIGHTILASPDGPVKEFVLYDGMPELLAQLGKPAQMGILATHSAWNVDSIRQALAGVGSAAPLFNPDLLYTSLAFSPGSPHHESFAANGSKYLFVSTSRYDRGVCAARGMRTVPHRALVKNALAGEKLLYVRIRAKAVAGGNVASPTFATLAALALPLLPTYVCVADSSLFALVADSALPPLAARYDVGEIADAATTDLYLLRDCLDESDESVEFVRHVEATAVRTIKTADGLIVALGPEHDVDRDFHVPRGQHGHTQWLPPCESAFLSAPVTPAVGPAYLSDAHARNFISALTTDLIDTILPIWCTGKEIVSRHTAHEHNKVAVKRAGAEFDRILGAGKATYLPIKVTTSEPCNVQAEIRGQNHAADVVIIAAHLDSTSANYNTCPKPKSDEAPGANDNASGMTGVLAAATALHALSVQTSLQRTIRFLLFNAEEQGCRGSKSYVNNLIATRRGTGERVVAVLVMDMIGWVAGTSPRADNVFEIHTCAPSDVKPENPTVASAARNLGTILGRVAKQVSPDLCPELHPTPENEPDLMSGKGGSSDHFPFLARGIPACLAAEDLFADTCKPSPCKVQYPWYHRTEDTIDRVDRTYIADIARAVAATAWAIANPDQEHNPQPRLTTTKEMPMRKPLLVHFIADFLRDEEFRARLLHNEDDAMTKYGLDTEQMDLLREFDSGRILAELGNELQQLCEDVDKKGREVSQSILRMRTLAASASAYEAGALHIFGVYPQKIRVNETTEVIVRGNGFDRLPEFRFALPADAKVEPPTKHFTFTATQVVSEVDLNQRARIKVTLDEVGIWRVQGRNAPTEQSWNAKDIGTIEVIR